MPTTVAPDLDFIRSLKAFGGENLKNCYQCATCSVVCPISTDDRPFPRPEMIHAQWGMKEKLVTDPLVWVCHNCRDCSSYCPRGAKPGELLAAVRDYTITHFGWPGGFARLFNSAKFLPLLFAIPVIVLLGVLGLEGHLHIPEGRIVYSKLFPIHTLEYIYIPVAFFGFIAGLMGMRRYWTAISAHRSGESPRRGLVEAAILTGKEILTHTQFKKCSVEGKRYYGHLPMLYGFLGAFLTTLLVTVYYYTGINTPLKLYDPVKILANVSAVALLYGCGLLVARRFQKEPEERNNLPSSYFDWLFLGLLTAVAVTGTLTELTRLSGAAGIAYPTYFIHLSLIFMLLGYMPYSKFAHIFYRTAAMVHEKMYEAEPVAVVLPGPPEEPPEEVEEEEEEEEEATPAAAGAGAPATSPLGGGSKIGGGAPPSMFGGSKIGGGAPPSSPLGGGSKIGGGAPPSSPLGGGGGIGGTPPPAPGGGSKIGGSPPPAGGSTIGGSPPPPPGGSKIGGSPPPPPGGSKIGGSPPPPAPGGSKIGGSPPPPMFGGVPGGKPPAPPAPPAEEEEKKEE